MQALTGSVAPMPEQSDQVDIPKILRTFVRRRRPMLAIFFGFLAIVVAFSLFLPRTYTTQVKMIAGRGGSVENPNSTSDLPVLNALMAANNAQTPETYVELFQETPVADAVIRNLSLKTTPGKLLKHIDVRPVTNTTVLTLFATWSDPRMSASIANGFAQAVVERERDLVASQATSALQFLTQELPAAQRNVERTADKLARYQAQHHIADLNSQTTTLVSTLAALDSKIGQTLTDQHQAEAQLASEQAQLAHTPATINGGTTVAQNPVLTQLEQQLSQVQVQLDTARKQYTDEHPTVIALRNQVEQLKREIAQQNATIVANSNTVNNPLYQQLQQQAAQYQAQIAADKAAITQMQQQRNQMNPMLQALPGEAATLAALQRDSSAAADVYTALQQKYKDAEIAKSTSLSDVTITQPATPGQAAVHPNLAQNLVLGIGFGFVLAILGAFVLDYFDNSVKDEEEAAQELALPLLGSIPLVKMRDGVAELPWVRTLTIESFLQLVTAMKYSSDSPIRTLSVTSPSQGDGKSTIALNVAIAMAEIEPRVLLIDGDLRRPSIHAKLRMKNDRGLSDILVGRARFEECIQKTRYPGLDLLPSGTPAPNPIKLFGSHNMDELFREAIDAYRTVIVDGAALSANLDSAILSRKTDGTIIVLSAGQTDLRYARNIINKLRQCKVENILGFVLNRVAPQRKDYADYALGKVETADEETPMITS